MAIELSRVKLLILHALQSCYSATGARLSVITGESTATISYNIQGLLDCGLVKPAPRTVGHHKAAPIMITDWGHENANMHESRITKAVNGLAYFTPRIDEYGHRIARNWK